MCMKHFIVFTTLIQMDVGPVQEKYSMIGREMAVWD